jgi:putative DNA methylase
MMKAFYERHLPHWQPDTRIIFVTYRLFGSLPKEVMERLSREREQLRKTPPLSGESPAQKALRDGKRMFALVDEALARAEKPQDSDTASGRTLTRCLGKPEIARIVVSNLHHHENIRYRLHRYVIMPNHVHLLIEPLPVVGQAASLSLLDQSSAGLSLLEQSSASPPDSTAEKPDNQNDRLAACPTEPEYWPLAKIMHGIKSYTANQANRILGRTGTFWQDESYDHWVRDTDEYRRILHYIDQNPVKAGLCSAPADWPWSSAFEEAQK